jgi:tetratricopeptide (TPR) repeat protein
VQTALARALEAKPEAIAVDGALRKQDPVAAAFLSGVALFARGELEPAAVQFREALRVDAEFAPAIVYLGACYAAGGRDREAAGAWQTALISETEDAVLPALLADAWLRVDDAEAALEILDEAIGRWPDDRELSGRRVTALLAQGRVADGLTALDAHVGASADQLLAGMRLIVEAHMVRKPIASPESDRERLQKYADRYRAANGPQQALVSSWLANWP